MSKNSICAALLLMLLVPAGAAAGGVGSNPNHQVLQPLGDDVPLCLNAPPWHQFDGVDAGDHGRVNAYDFFTGHQGDEGLDVAFVVFCPFGPDGELFPWPDDPDPLPHE